MVRCAPLRIPLERRLQTAAVLFALCVMPSVFGFVAALAVWPPLTQFYSRELLAGYCIWWLLIDRKTPSHGGRPSSWFRKLTVWRYVRDYFPAQLHLPEGGYDKSKPAIFCLHPHGVISIAAICNFIFGFSGALDALPDYRVATVSFNFLAPLWREITMALGFVVASRSSIRWLLDHGLSAMIVIGGAQETLHAVPGTAELVLAKRKGFIRLALLTGAQLVPVYHFGETELYTQARTPLLRKLQMLAIRVLGFTVPLVRGRGIFQYDVGILPRRVPLHTVMGPAIPVDKVASPTPQQIDALHERYIAALTRLHDENRERFAKPTDFFGNPLAPQPLRIVA